MNTQNPDYSHPLSSYTAIFLSGVR